MDNRNKYDKDRYRNGIFYSWTTRSTYVMRNGTVIRRYDGNIPLSMPGGGWYLPGQIDGTPC